MWKKMKFMKQRYRQEGMLYVTGDTHGKVREYYYEGLCF